MQEAVPLYQTPLRLKPDMIHPRVNLISCLQTLGRNEECVELAQVACQAEPTNHDRPFALGVIPQGRVPSAQGRLNLRGLGSRRLVAFAILSHHIVTMYRGQQPLPRFGRGTIPLASLLCTMRFSVWFGDGSALAPQQGATDLGDSLPYIPDCRPRLRSSRLGAVSRALPEGAVRVVVHRHWHEMSAPELN